MDLIKGVLLIIMGLIFQSVLDGSDSRSHTGSHRWKPTLEGAILWDFTVFQELKKFPGRTSRSQKMRSGVSLSKILSTVNNLQRPLRDLKDLPGVYQGKSTYDTYKLEGFPSNCWPVKRLLWRHHNPSPRDTPDLRLGASIQARSLKSKPLKCGKKILL